MNRGIHRVGKPEIDAVRDAKDYAQRKESMFCAGKGGRGRDSLPVSGYSDSKAINVF